MRDRHELLSSYKVAHDRSIDAFEGKCKALLDAGYRPHGKLIVHYNHGYWNCFQAFVK